jgi:hypothetical protein
MKLDRNNITFTSYHTYMFNFHTGQIKSLDPDKPWDNRWRIVTSVLYPFSVYDVKKYIPNAEKVFFYKSPKGYFDVADDDIFYGYVVSRNGSILHSEHYNIQK